MSNVLLTDFDLHLLAQGTHYQSYEKLGAHRRSVDGVSGIHFAVWAPKAGQGSVMGDFNGWSPEAHPMLLRSEAGVWELFVRDLGPGAQYRNHVRSPDGKYRADKADPHGFAAEIRPQTASKVGFDCSFTPIPRPNYRIGVPWGGAWATPIPLHGRPYSLNRTIPPYGVVVFEGGATAGQLLGSPS